MYPLVRRQLGPDLVEVVWIKLLARPGKRTPNPRLSSLYPSDHYVSDIILVYNPQIWRKTQFAWYF